MGEPYLYTVDSEGESTQSPPPPGGPTDESKSQRAPAKARPTEPVPTDRMKFDTQVKALLTACTASRNGSEWITADNMAAMLGISPATAPLNNAFYVYLNLLEKRGKGEYRPTEISLRFQQRWTFDKKTAPTILAPAFEDSWFLDAVKQKLALGEATVDEMVETLALVANTDNSYATQYTFCLEWLQYVGLITMENGVVRLVGDGVAPVDPGVVRDDGAQPSADERPPAAPAQEEIEVQDAQRPLRQDGPPTIVSMSIDISLTADDLRKLSSEQISALFDGVGKVAAVKAALA